MKTHLVNLIVFLVKTEIMDKIRKLVCSTNIDDVLLAYILVQDTDKFHKYFKVNPHTDNVVYPKFSDNQIFIQRSISLDRRE